MDKNRDAINQFYRIALCNLVCLGIMLFVCFLIGKFSKYIILGGIFGTVLSILNFLFLTISVCNAASLAEETGDSAKATLHIRSGTVIRRIVIAVIYIVVLKFSDINAITAILPLIFTQISITITGFFRKEREKKE